MGQTVNPKTGKVQTDSSTNNALILSKNSAKEARSQISMLLFYADQKRFDAIDKSEFTKDQKKDIQSIAQTKERNPFPPGTEDFFKRLVDVIQDLDRRLTYLESLNKNTQYTYVQLTPAGGGTPFNKNVVIYNPPS